MDCAPLQLTHRVFGNNLLCRSQSNKKNCLCSSHFLVCHLIYFSLNGAKVVLFFDLTKFLGNFFAYFLPISHIITLSNKKIALFSAKTLLFWQTICTDQKKVVILRRKCKNTAFPQSVFVMFQPLLMASLLKTHHERHRRKGNRKSFR